MADILVQSRGGDELTWGAGADIVTQGKARANYIECILKADAGDFAPLLAFARS
jgi:hypothetical protein